MRYEISDKRYKTKGYTLIEVLVYSAILAVFLLLTSQIFISMKLSSANSASLNSLSQNLRQIVSELEPTVREAVNITQPLPGETTAILSLNSGAILYQVQGGILKKTESGQTWNLTTDEVKVSNLSFQNPVEATQTGAIKIKMIVESNYALEGGEKLSENLETSISQR